MPEPLQGRLILDCSTHLPGPMVGKLLAGKGARVLKIENPDRPDPAREMGAFYEDLNADKELVLLNLLKEADQQKFRTLVREADGLIEGFRPAAKIKLQLDEKSLHAINPRLCILSLVGYPEDGPWRDRPGHDNNFQAVTGCLSLFREMPALPLADLFTAYESAFSLAAALADGNGRRIVVSMTETLKNVQSMLVAETGRTGQLPHPGTTLFSGKFPCYRLYLAADGRRVSMGALERKFWEKACAILGVAELAPKGYAEGADGEATAAKVQQAFGAKPWTHWAPLFDQADCCVEPVLDYSEVYGV